MSLISRFMNAQIRDDTLHESWATLGDAGEEGMFMTVGLQRSHSADDENSSELSEDILAELSIEDAASGDDDDDLLSLDSSDSDEAPAAPAKGEEPAAGGGDDPSGGEGDSSGGGGSDGDGGGDGGAAQTISAGGFGDDILTAFRSSSSESDSDTMARDLEDIRMQDLLTDMKEIHQMFGDRIVPETKPESEAEESA